MSPVNHDPSQDDAVATGRLPLTRRELRARERFLATQNQDVVPASAYALAEFEQQGPATPPDADSAAPPEPQAPPAIPPVPAEPPLAAEPAVPVVPALPGPEGMPDDEPAAHTDGPGDVGTHDDDHLNLHATRAMDTAPSDAHHDDAHHDDAHHELHATRAMDTVPRDAHHDELHHDDHDAHLDVPAAVALHHDAVLDDAHHDDGYGDGYYDAVRHDDAPADFHADGSHDDYHYVEDGHGGYDPDGPHDNHVLIGDKAVPALPRPSKKVRRRRRLMAVLLTLGVFVAAIAIGAQFLRPLLGMDKTANYPGPGTGVVKISIQPGAGPKAVATTLENQHIVANADAFLKEFIAAGGELSPGDYEFKNEMKNSDAVAVLLNRDSSKVMYFALNAGLRIGESLEAISKGSGVPLDQLKSLSDSPAQFGVPAKAKNLEGFLSPGEYRFPLGTPAKDILQKLVSTTLDELKAQGITDPAKQYDTITVASIVQAEGGQADYGNVAGAIYNRLKPNNTETNGLIQSDATVTYGLGRKSFHLEPSEKADKSNPYNTYANPGLPAGPIGSPGKTAIDAAAKPTANDYLYWVTINLDTKETKFSKTLAEHSRYVEQYNSWCNANPGRCV